MDIFREENRRDVRLFGKSWIFVAITTVNRQRKDDKNIDAL